MIPKVYLYVMVIFIISESLEKFPDLTWQPSLIGSGISRIALMICPVRTESYRISLIASRKFSNNMIAVVGRKLNGGIGIASIIFSMLQETIFSALLLSVIKNPVTCTIMDTCCLEISKGHMLVSRLRIKMPIGGGIAGDCS